MAENNVYGDAMSAFGMFELKKLIGALVMPLPAMLLLILLGLLLLWFTRWQKTGKTLISAGWIVLLLLSFQPVADALLRPTENKYPTYQPNGDVSFVIVLGGSYSYDPLLPPSAQVGRNTLARIAEGIRIYRMHPKAKLVFSGAPAASEVSSARVAAQVASSLGAPKEDMVLIETPRDTEDEALAMKALIKDQPAVLVTSASHLPRAMRLFADNGMHPIPAPANQLTSDGHANFWETYFPAASYLERSERAWYELLGEWWLTLKGKH